MTLLEAEPRRAAPTGLTELSWLEHLNELRRRLLICIAAAGLATVVAWFFYDHLLQFMIRPYQSYLSQHPGRDISHGNLVVTSPLEGFTTRLKVSAYAGIVLASPVWIWETWRFVAPGLYRNERRGTIALTGSAMALFGLGVATAVAVFPKALNWLISVGGAGIVPLFSPSRYLGLYTAMCVVFGVVFTYPVFLVGLEMAGAVTSGKLRRWRRQAVIACCAVSAIITPSGDPFSFLALAIPMVVLYEAAILTGRALGK
jgi:sec-independent protein translocase protein TatC